MIFPAELGGTGQLIANNWYRRLAARVPAGRLSPRETVWGRLHSEGAHLGRRWPLCHLTAADGTYEAIEMNPR